MVLRKLRQVEFLRTIDLAFDVLNSRNPLAKGSKAPLRSCNKLHMLSLLERAENFLLQLRDSSGRHLHAGPRKTGPIGFVASSRSISNIFKELVEAQEAPCKYLLTYKLSQDHLELFFSAVRARGGYNNNPTARQFKAAYKRLLVRHQVKNGTGNCLIRDGTNMLAVTVVPASRQFDVTPALPLDSDHDYSILPYVESISEFKDAAIHYIAGFVVKKMEKILCMPCSLALSSDSSMHAFIALKNRGGLQNPSTNIVEVCKASERCFQRLLTTSGGKLPQGKGVTAAITIQVLSDCADKNIFSELHNHMFETSVEDNHVHTLVKMAASMYCKIRLHHLARRETEKVTGALVRRRMNKLILFHHQ